MPEITDDSDAKNKKRRGDADGDSKYLPFAKWIIAALLAFIVKQQFTLDSLSTAIQRQTAAQEASEKKAKETYDLVLNNILSVKKDVHEVKQDVKQIKDQSQN